MENCPYCDAEIEINHDDGYGYDESEAYQQECGSCNKTFTFTTSISYCYHIEQADCLNGGEHDLKPIIGAPREYFVGKKRCTICSEEFITDKEAHEKAMESLRQEYSKK